MFSVVLPCFNESRHGYLPQILENLTQQAGENQLIVAISPSEDETLAVVQRFPEINIIHTEATNRAQRLNVGIAASRGDYVLLHHPATLLPEKNALLQAEAVLKQAVWGGFGHSFDMAHPLLRFTSWYSTKVRSQQQGILYLDHCIFARREALQAIGGVPDMDIFEDTALSVALRDWAQGQGDSFSQSGKSSTGKSSTGRPMMASSYVITSARRFRDRGVYRQAFVNQVLKGFYYLGVDPQRMNWLYERKSQINVAYAEAKAPVDQKVP